MQMYAFVKLSTTLSQCPSLITFSQTLLHPGATILNVHGKGLLQVPLLLSPSGNGTVEFAARRFVKLAKALTRHIHGSRWQVATLQALDTKYVKKSLFIMF